MAKINCETDCTSEDEQFSRKLVFDINYFLTSYTLSSQLMAIKSEQQAKNRLYTRTQKKTQTSLFGYRVNLH